MLVDNKDGLRNPNFCAMIKAKDLMLPIDPSFLP
jgi:hypothetical protein